MRTLRAAAEAGARRLVLCDTNGGCFPDEIERITAEANRLFPGMIGIHCHNDTGCAVANTIAAVRAGACHVQGAYTGLGERCGNTNLSTVIADLQLKLGYDCVPEDCISRMTGTARMISEIANVSLPHTMPYVGKSAFAHKGGMHVDGAQGAGTLSTVLYSRAVPDYWRTGQRKPAYGLSDGQGTRRRPL